MPDIFGRRLSTQSNLKIVSSGGNVDKTKLYVGDTELTLVSNVAVKLDANELGI